MEEMRPMQQPQRQQTACAQPGEGRLPCCAPLANPYVPFQQEESPKYEARRGLIRGTLFPGLDLPFMGMVNNTEKSDTPMHELQALAFAIQELALYLDTHREDRPSGEGERSPEMTQGEKGCLTVTDTPGGATFCVTLPYG